jgi:hypothetical protein
MYIYIIFVNFSRGATIYLLFNICAEIKGKAITLQSWAGPEGSRRLKPPEFLDNRNMNVVRLSALRTGRLYPPGYIPGTHFCYRLSQFQGHSAAGRIKLMKSPNDPIGNRSRGLPARSAVSQRTAPPRTPK